MTATTAAEIWRDYATDGDPSSGVHKPLKSEIRAWGTAVESGTGLLEEIHLRTTTSLDPIPTLDLSTPADLTPAIDILITERGRFLMTVGDPAPGSFAGYSAAQPLQILGQPVTQDSAFNLTGVYTTAGTSGDIYYNSLASVTAWATAEWQNVIGQLGTLIATQANTGGAALVGNGIATVAGAVAVGAELEAEAFAAGTTTYALSLQSGGSNTANHPITAYVRYLTLCSGADRNQALYGHILGGNGQNPFYSNSTFLLALNPGEVSIADFFDLRNVTVSGFYWRSPGFTIDPDGDTTAKSLVLGAGSQAAPSLRMGSDTATGWFQAGANSQSFSVSNFTILGLSTGRIDTNAIVNIGAQGSVSAPTLVFGIDTNTGWYQAANNVWNFSASGTTLLQFDSSGVIIATQPLTVSTVRGPSGGTLTVAGGQGTSSNNFLTLKSTTGNGSGDYISFTGGNNGATQWARLNATGLSVAPSNSSQTPDALLTLSGNTSTLPASAFTNGIHIGAADAGVAGIGFDAFGGSNQIQWRRANGTNASPTALAADDAIGNLAVRGYNGSAYTTGNQGNFGFLAAETWSVSTNSTYFQVAVVPTATTGNASQIMQARYITNNTDPRVGIGNIGTATPTYSLSFAGQVARTIGIERSTSSVAGRDLTISAAGAASGGTNLAAGNVDIKTGIATGNGGGSVNIYGVAANQGSGTTDRNPALVATFQAGIQVGAPTGGDKGAGTINAAGDIYKNNSAYTNPDYVFEHHYLGKVERFITSPGAKDYRGRLPLPQLRAFTREHMRLPGIDNEPMGIFSRADKALEIMEEQALYIMELHERLAAVEARH